VFKALIQTIPDLVWVKDREGVYLTCNHAFERFFGATESEIVGKSDFDFVDSALAEFFRKNDQVAMDANKPTINEEELTFAVGGYHGVFETIKAPLKNEQGETIGVLGIARDISERHNAKLWTQAIYDNINDAIFIVDAATGCIVDVNEKAQLLVGRSKRELLGLHQSLLHPPHLHEEQSQEFKHAASGKYFYTTTQVIHKDGHTIPVEISVKEPFKIADKSYVCGAFRDISHRLRIQEEFAAKERKEIELFHQARINSMGKMLSAIAHHWRQPLNVISLLTESVQESIDESMPNKAFIDKSCNTIVEATRELSQTIDSVREFIKSEKSTKKIHPSKAIDAVINVFEGQLSFNKITLVVHNQIPLETPALNLHIAFIEQALFAILHNAKDAILLHREKIEDAPEGKIVVSLGIEERMLVITVEDNGGGIDEKSLPLIFDPFFTTKERGVGSGMISGVGLDLYVIKLSIEGELGGSITATNHNDGACFRMSIPLD